MKKKRFNHKNRVDGNRWHYTCTICGGPAPRSRRGTALCRECRKDWGLPDLEKIIPGPLGEKERVF